MKRIGKRDGMIEALLTQDEYESVRELPPPPVCFLCHGSGAHLTSIPSGSKYDGEWNCPICLDNAINEFVGGRG